MNKNKIISKLILCSGIILPFGYIAYIILYDEFNNKTNKYIYLMLLALIVQSIIGYIISLYFDSLSIILKVLIGIYYLAGAGAILGLIVLIFCALSEIVISAILKLADLIENYT
jgi:hypothetical protein